ncbi:hypothetical protein RB595_010118 [Gaeumannomyces hyphopodioides]
MPGRKILIYLLRKDLRVTDNPVLHHLASHKDHGFTHMLPVFVFPAHQIEVSGFVKDGSKSPYAEARGRVSRYRRCGPYRAKFIAESVWDLKSSFESLDSGLELRAGMFKDVAEGLLDGLKKRGDTGAVWMTAEVCPEETADEDAIAAVCQQHGFEFQRWVDEKYFVDDRDLNFKEAHELPQIFTDYRKSVEPLRQKPRKSLPRPAPGSLPAFPEAGSIPEQAAPFVIPETYEKLELALLLPLNDSLEATLPSPDGSVSAHPFRGGEDAAQERLGYVLSSGIMSKYKQTRNGLVGADFSTKLSAYLAQGCITARQVHEALVGLEDGTNPKLEGAEGFGKGETDDIKAVREELMWRDYMRLYTKKIGAKLFSVDGYQSNSCGDAGAAPAEDQPPAAGDAATATAADADATNADATSTSTYQTTWKTADPEAAASAPEQVQEAATHLERFKAGTTGLGLIDASQRELLHTGYTSNRGRQNVASFLSKHLGIDWRYGAEWYEMMLVDYDACSNWGNWQYVAGVGFDPRGKARIFNPIKQAFDYDKDGAYVRMWLPELAPLASLENLFQVCTTPPDELEAAGLAANVMATDPVKRIGFSVSGKPPSARQVRRQAIRAGARAAAAAAAAAAGGPMGHHSPPGTSNADGAGNGSEQDRAKVTAGASAATATGTSTSSRNSNSNSSNMRTMPPQGPRAALSNRGQWGRPARGYHVSGPGRGAPASGYGGGPPPFGGGSSHNPNNNLYHRGGPVARGAGWSRRGGPGGRTAYATATPTPPAARASPAGGLGNHGGRHTTMVVSGGNGFVARATTGGGRGATSSPPSSGGGGDGPDQHSATPPPPSGQQPHPDDA